MKYIATFDIGTTAVKGVLVSLYGQSVANYSVNIPTIFTGEFKEQDPRDWYEAFCEISRKMVMTVDAKEITGIIMSGQMQDLILVDQERKPIRNAILYSDSRAVKQADDIIHLFGIEYLQDITGNNYDGSLSFPKLLWIKENEPEVYARIHKVLISSKDYIIAQLTGECCGDYTACSTAGLMNIQTKSWEKAILEKLDIDTELFPNLYPSHERVGRINSTAHQMTGFTMDTLVYAGVGDAGATTLASGISKKGQYNINLGTSGWVATVSDSVMNQVQGVFSLAAMPEGKYINVVPFFNAGNVHKWISSIFTRDTQINEIDYTYVNTLLEHSIPGSQGLLFLPYLVGERFPVVDTKVKGCYVGLTPKTSKEDMVRACLEGVAYSIKQGIESIGEPSVSVSVIGGGARVTTWCQIISDVLGIEVHVYLQSDTLPALAIASAVLLKEGLITDYEEFTKTLQQQEYCKIYQPKKENSSIYLRNYRNFLKVYPAIKELTTE